MSECVKRWISPDQYATIVTAGTDEPLSKWFPSGIGITLMDGEIVRVENATHEEFNYVEDNYERT